MEKTMRKKIRELIEKLMLEVDDDLEIRKLAEENQRKYGTLSAEELQRRFTI